MTGEPVRMGSGAGVGPGDGLTAQGYRLIDAALTICEQGQGA